MTCRLFSAGLAAEGITRFEYVVATHDHDDHLGEMGEVLPQVTFGRIDFADVVRPFNSL